MFLGEYQTSFTGSGRIILPRKMRSQLQGEKVILSRGMDQCIWGFDLDSWGKQTEKQLQTSIIDPEGRDLRRYLFSAAEEVELDKQGRIVIPPQLLTYAKLTDQVMVIGAGDHFEIWQPTAWHQLLSRLEERKL